jgi:hypothetical protein
MMNLEELLGRFRSGDIAHALRGLGLAASGTKSQRLNRLLTATNETVASDILEMFRIDDLHRVCAQLGVDTGPHAEMVDGLARQVATEGGQPAPVVAAEPATASSSEPPRLPRVDWRRTAAVTGALAIVIGAGSIVATVVDESDGPLTLWLGVTLVAVVTAGYRFSTYSPRSGYLASAVLGSVAGLAFIVGPNWFIEFEPLSIPISAATGAVGAMFATLGGALGYRLRHGDGQARGIGGPRWLRAVVVLVALAMVIGAGTAVTAAVDVSDGLLPGWLTVMILVAAGASLSRYSPGSGYLGSAVLGSVGGLAFSIGPDSNSFVGTETVSIPVSAVIGAMLATAGSAVGYLIGTGSSRARGMGAPNWLRLYFFWTGLISVVLVAWLVLYGGADVISVPAVFTLALVPVLILYPRYNFRLSFFAGRLVSYVLCLWCVSLIGTAVVVLVLSITAFPRDDPYEEELVVTFGPQSEQDAFNRLAELTQEGERERNYEAALDLLAETPLSVPRPYSFSTKTPNFTGFLELGTTGTKEVASLLDRGRDTEAYEEYLLLWNIARNLVSAEGSITLIQYLVGIATAGVLADWYLENDDARSLPGDGRLLAVVTDFQAALDDGFASAMTAEYATLNLALVDEIFKGEENCPDDYLGMCALKLQWPFHDTYEMLKVRHDLLVKLVAANREPAYGERDSLVEHIQGEFDRHLRFTPWTNPFGSAVYIASFPNIVRFTGRSDEVKGQISIIRYLLESGASGSYDDIPVDPFSGKPFRVTRTPDAIEIASPSLGSDGEPRFKYEITTARR